MKSYAQHGEDVLIFNQCGGYLKGIIDIGANDGITYSNSRLFLEQGIVEGSSILIEPSAKSFKLLSELYTDTNVITLQSAVVKQSMIVNGKTQLYVGNIPGDVGDELVSTTIESEVNYWVNARGVDYKVQQVPAITPEQLFSDLSSSGISHFDLVSIDTEGLDLYILKSYLSHYNIPPRFIIIEHNLNQDCLDFIQSMSNYTVIFNNTINSVLRLS